MRVFVTCIGRCGSVSFRKACRYTTNFRTGHETNCGQLEYPDNFIEVSPQIRSVIQPIATKYPDALWVHLYRDPAACMRSLIRLEHGDVLRAYQKLFPSIMPSNQLVDVAERFYYAENNRIELALRLAVPEANRRVMHLETIQDEWSEFWDWIGAEGNYMASLLAWDVKRNTAEERGEV